jgi:hypothetical protein
MSTADPVGDSSSPTRRTAAEDQPERPETWPNWVSDLDDLIRRAENQHSDMMCCCSVDDACYVGLLLEAIESGLLRAAVGVSDEQ